jgi:putative endonuclease
MYYIYVIHSLKDNRFYTGYTENLKQRIEEHNNGLVVSTKRRLPFKLVYYESSISQKDALAREKYLKTGMGKKYIKIRIKNYLEN